MPPKPLEKLDIIITIFNQEEIIERVLYGIFRNTTTPFNLILVFDGCTDKTKPRALKYLKKVKPKLLRELIVKDTPNLFELRANNFAFKLVQTDYLITIQDDMVINEYGWERRLTYPLRKFDDVFAVTARVAENIESIGGGNQKYINRVALELNLLSKDTFAIRDVINRGPIAFRADRLKEINYLNDKYAPSSLDDYEICLRAWVQKKWKVGAYWIKYLSEKEWSKVSAPDSTMKTWDSWRRNNDKIYADFKEYLDSHVKHDEDRSLPDREVDYIKNPKTISFLKYPLRLDKRVIKTRSKSNIRILIEKIKKPFLVLLGSRLRELTKEHGFKKATSIYIKEKTKRV